MGSDRERLPAPRRSSVRQTGGDVSLRIRRLGPQTLLVFVVAVIWNGFLVFGMWMGGHTLGGLIAAAPFVLIHLALGALMGYQLLVDVLNAYRVEVRGGRLTAWDGPIPPWHRVVLPASDITQLYCANQVIGRGNTRVHLYAVHARRRDGRDHRVLGRIQSLHAALWIEQELEACLGLPDLEVEGAVTTAALEGSLR